MVYASIGLFFGQKMGQKMGVHSLHSLQQSYRLQLRCRIDARICHPARTSPQLSASLCYGILDNMEQDEPNCLRIVLRLKVRLHHETYRRFA
jgi:hypothetical protein